MGGPWRVSWISLFFCCWGSHGPAKRQVDTLLYQKRTFVSEVASSKSNYPNVHKLSRQLALLCTLCVTQWKLTAVKTWPLSEQLTNVIILWNLYGKSSRDFWLYNWTTKPLKNTGLTSGGDLTVGRKSGWGPYVIPLNPSVHFLVLKFHIMSEKYFRSEFLWGPEKAGMT